MGRLFENVTMDIQAERRNTAEARAELAAVREETMAVQQELDAILQELAAIQQERDAILQELAAIQQERAAAQELEIYKYLLHTEMWNCSETETIESLMCHFHLTHAQAEKTLKQIFED